MTSAEKALAALRAVGLSDVLYLPGQESYNTRVASYWSLTAQLRPWAIVQPRNTLEVSKAVKAIVSVPAVRFAVRRCAFPSVFVRSVESDELADFVYYSGGHMARAGANNIVDGITIDLGLMNSTTYNSKTAIASLEPGGSWAVSYMEIEKRSFSSHCLPFT